jgi:4-aminobutyrate aminotransferase-like enzyme
VSCAAALEVQRIIREDDLLTNVKERGKLLSSLLHKYLDGHPYVGNIRGRGLFWGVSYLTSIKLLKRHADQSQRSSLLLISRQKTHSRLHLVLPILFIQSGSKTKE